jgi:hypothetical protein
VKKYPELLEEITPETIADDDIIADIVSSIKTGEMEYADYKKLCVYSSLLDICSFPDVEGVFILYEQDKEELKNLLKNNQ